MQISYLYIIYLAFLFIKQFIKQFFKTFYQEQT